MFPDGSFSTVVNTFVLEWGQGVVLSWGGGVVGEFEVVRFFEKGA